MQNTIENTMDTFNKGFKIVRDGQVISLTSEEMSNFRYLDNACTGRDCIEIVRNSYDKTSDDYKVLSEMMQDEEICYNVEDDILNIAYQDCGAIEQDVILDYLKRNKADILQQLKEGKR